MPDFLLPDLGEGLEDAELTAWHVRVGDHVAVDQVVAEVETAKAAVEVPIPFAGTVTAVHAEPGTTLPVGAPLISVTADGPGPETRRNRASRPGQRQCAGRLRHPPVPEARSWPAQARGLRRHGACPGACSGACSGARSGADRPGAGHLTDSAQARPRGRARPGPHPRHWPGWAGAAPRREPGDRRPERAAARAAARPAGPQAAEVRIPIRGVRRTAAEKLTRSRREIPEATVWVDADATGLLAVRAALNAHAPQAPVSLLALLARFAVAGLRRWPELNARIEDEEIVIPAHVHLGFAVQTERGLVVPVIRDAHLMSVRELAAALGRQTAAARAGRLAPADLTGGTVTVNNYGVFGVDGSAAIINHPEVAILGLGRIIDRPWVVDGQLAVRKVTELTLAFDHRVCDGGTAGGYLRYVADCVESPLLALGDL